MDKLQLKAILAGILFGIYPLLLNKSRLTGNIMATSLSLLVCIFILPFAFGEIKCLATADWKMLIGAGVASAVGMMCLSSFLALSKPSSVGVLIILMIITQATVTAVYQMIMDKGITTAKLFGFGCAAIAIVLLNKK
ncbi:MAG: hypothetical protein A2928_03355 [Candidatus Taylorbacteria bacterium RIFCSPLOWO2_01_FULL_45_15b]|uniref:EamA domain-containing protein n=1 Tax=Candidatus Taylorbacteria bacterium RIFCSPLOWO2_01_FULL_45_15b TaxID=1802319 RepID=A0A1G2NFZ7_9BACT|nr:MAG: hypothetical protein A2928_03355 [Candidatus Taylorbacteria bacterium RIFCSPLOWO2_01_FULL_45_15b]